MVADDGKTIPTLCSAILSYNELKSGPSAYGWKFEGDVCRHCSQGFGDGALSGRNKYGAGDDIHLIACLPGMHEVLGLITCLPEPGNNLIILALGRDRQEDHKLKVNIIYAGISRPARAIAGPAFKEY